jgi:hypothetical protein
MRHLQWLAFVLIVASSWSVSARSEKLTLEIDEEEDSKTITFEPVGYWKI